MSSYRAPEMTSSGVLEFDRITNGGVPRGKITLISGPSGSGKTIFGLQFLVEGANRSETGILALTDHEPMELIQEAEVLGIPLLSLLNAKKIYLLVLDSKRTFEARGHRIFNAKSEDEFLEMLEQLSKRLKAKRVVLDSFTALIAARSRFEARKKILQITGTLNRLGPTVLATGFVPSGSRALSFMGLEESYVSGLISLGSTSIDGVIVRYLFVPKMKGTDHNLQRFAYDIEPRLGVRLLDPLKDIISRRHEGSSETLKDALQIASVLKSLALSNIQPSSPGLSSTRVSEDSSIEGETLSPQFNSVIGLSNPRISGEASYTRPSPKLSGKPQQLSAKPMAPPPKRVEVTDAKLPSSAAENPWASILSTRDEESEKQVAE